MNVVVFGAAGKTGNLVVEKAIQAGHTVTAFVRDANRGKHSGARVVTGDVGDAASVRIGVVGQDAVIDTIGGKTPYKNTELEKTAVRNIIDAMQSEGARRLIVVSMMGIGESSAQAPLWYRYLLMPTFLRGSTRDKTAMEAAVKASGLSFVIARPPILSEQPAIGPAKIIGTEMKGHKVTRSDLAQFLVDQLEDDKHLDRAVVVANS